MVGSVVEKLTSPVELAEVEDAASDTLCCSQGRNESPPLELTLAIVSAVTVLTGMIQVIF